MMQGDSNIGKMYNMEEKKEEVNLGDEMTVFVMKGKGDSIISRLKDGRVILFNRENPIFSDLTPGVVVKSNVSFIAQNYIIVDPISPPDSGSEALKLGLNMVSESENWEMSILSKAILYIMEKIEELT
jgi:hypothetical protein